MVSFYSDAERLHALGLYAPGDPRGSSEEPRCGACGCTDNDACEGPCYWMPDHLAADYGYQWLCSSCWESLAFGSAGDA